MVFRSMKKQLLMSTVATLSIAAISVPKASAAPIVLTFEGLDNLAPVGNFYDTAPNDFDVTFSPNALAIIDRDAGGSGNFGGEPSPSTVLFFLDGPAATLNAANGFTTGFSFFYSAIVNPGFIRVYDGLNGTGNVLATLDLPVTPSDGGDPNGEFSPFVPVGVSFSGTARSIDFGGTVNQIGFDNVTFGSSTPIPTPALVPAMIGFGISALRKRKAMQQKQS
ncbi:hypothetical protein LEP3755_53710 [Leptolyngbya sp. NIES-3755]|nr:hypothetical protein LEP3755_53710 [Leptolyngbya sp. NIES-3755]